MDDAGRRPSDESFASVAEHAPAMLWRGDAQGKCVYLNRAQREFWGVPADKVDEFTWASTLLEEDAQLVYGPFGEGMAKRQPFTCEARYRRADGAVRILATRAEPRFDSNGEFTGMVGVNVDVTDERRAQTELAESEARLRSLADNLPYGMIYQIVRDEQGVRRFSFVSSRCQELNGVSAEAAMADPALLHSLIVPEDIEAFAAAEAAAFAAMRPFEAEARIRKPNGEVRWYKVASAPRKVSDGSVVWDGVQVDIHEAKAAEERRLMLMREMGHRIKNNLATVLSIATQTGRSASTYEAFNTAFQARLHALAKSHELLMQDETDSAELSDILHRALSPYRADAALGRSYTLTGEPVRVSGRAAMGLALVMHELATNAAKYGAFASGGAIEVSWSLVTPAFVQLEWRERGGPAAAPGKSGFGSRLIESVLRSELGGGLVTRLTPRGFEADIGFSTMPEGQ